MNDQEKPEGSPGVIKVRQVIAFLALAMILFGQFILFALPVHEGVAFPPFLWLTIIGLLLFLLSLVIRPAGFLQKWFERLPSGASAWILAALVFSALAAFSSVLFRTQGHFNFIPITTVWLAAGLCYLAAFRTRFPTAAEWKGWLNGHRTELLILAAIVLLAIGLRFYELGSLPRVIDGDEGRMGQAAQSTSDTRLANPFALFENFGGLYLQISNFSIYLFGATPFALRLLPAISGVLAIPATYLLARHIAGRRVALLTAFLLTISHTHIHFSRIASVGYIHDTWLVPLELYLLLSGIEKRSSWRAALAGVLLAIHFSVYLTAQIILGLVVIYLVIAFLFLRAWIRPALSQIAAFFGGFLTMLVPEVVYIIRQPSEFLNRLGENGTFQSGWLTDMMASTGRSAMQILGERILHAFLALIYYPAFDFYGSPIPMLTLVSTMLFLAGMGIVLLRTRSPRFLLLNGYFWGGTVAIGLFAIPPSADSYRMLMVLPAALLMAALGLEQIINLFGMGWSASRAAYTFSTGAVLVSLLVFNVWTYYGDFAGQCRFGNDLAGRFASYLGNYVRGISSESSVYLLSDEFFFYGSHASANFLSHGRSITNFPESLETLNPVSGETIIAVPSRIEELETWARLHPGGDLRYQYDCKNTILLAYQVP
jgi:hypothetical protein